MPTGGYPLKICGVLPKRPVGSAYPLSFTTGTPRLLTPVAPGPLTVAAFNVHNYFDAVCGPSANQSCRGADFASELQRQTEKLVAVLCDLDADIVGLMEIENNANSSLNMLVTALNSTTDCDPYDFINAGTVGTDAIKVGLLYKTDTVALDGAYAVLDTAAFVDPNNLGAPKNRPALAQTFRDIATNQQLLLVVNHLKSKGSSCGAGDDDTTTGQGNCNLTRTLAANEQVAWLAADPTGSGATNVLVIGDLNAYRNEDPVSAFLAGGYTDLLDGLVGPSAYRYVINGQQGYLDHALANPSLLPHVTGVTSWHVNADESGLLDYNDTVIDCTELPFEAKPAATLLYQDDAWRASDHDPVVVGLNLDRVCSPAPAPLSNSSISTLVTCTATGLIRVGAELTVTGIGELDVTAGKTIINRPFGVEPNGVLRVNPYTP